jgi:hypothetical protein
MSHDVWQIGPHVAERELPPVVVCFQQFVDRTPTDRVLAGREMEERLVQGVDVWINTPRQPWEASGTSGMGSVSTLLYKSFQVPANS